MPIRAAVGRARRWLSGTRRESRGLPPSASANPQVLGALDGPAPSQLVPRGLVHAWGWVLDPLADPRAVRLSVEGVQGRAHLGESRPDVEEFLGDPTAAGVAGWSAEIDLGQVSGREARIIASLERASGEIVPFGSTTVFLEPQLPELPGLRVMGNVDAPRDDQLAIPGTYPCWGWFLDEGGPASAIVVHLDGQPVVLARQGAVRADVAREHPDVENSLHSGWYTELNIEGRSGCPIEVRVTAIRANGTTFQVGRRVMRGARPRRPTSPSSPQGVHAHPVSEVEPLPALDEASIDFPAPGARIERGVLRVWGRALSGDRAPARVELTLNGAPVGSARVGIARPDASGLPAADAVVSGFEQLLDLSGIDPARRSILIGGRVHSMSGTAFPLPTTRVKLAPPPAAGATGGGARRLAELRARVVRIADARPPARSRQVRLVAFTHDLGYGGGQLYLFELLRRLCEVVPGFSCTLVAPRDGALRPAHEKLGIQVHLTSAFPVESAEQYEAKLMELAAWMRLEEFNLALVNTMLAFPGADLATRLNLPTLWAIHESLDLPILWPETDPANGLDPYVRGRGEASLRAASALIFEADATRRQYRPYAANNRLVTVQYGIDVTEIDRYRARRQRTDARRKLGLPVDSFVVLCLGTVEKRKAQTCLAQAFAAIAAQHPKAQLVFVGGLDTQYSRTLEMYIERLEMDDRIQVVPVVPDVYDWYFSADLFVCASDVESLPRSVLEAMAFDVPILATEVFGLPEILDDGRTGFLCPARDVAALARRLDEVLSLDLDSRLDVGVAGGAVVRQRHDSMGYARAYADLMTALLADPSSRPAEVLRERTRVPVARPVRR